VSFAWVESTARMSLRGTCERRRRLPPTVTRLLPVSVTETGGKSVADRSKNEGETAHFAIRGAGLKNRGRFPDLCPEHGVSISTPQKKKIYFLQRVCDPRARRLTLPNIDATSRTVVDVDGSSLVATFHVWKTLLTRLRTDSLREIYSFIAFVRLRHPRFATAAKYNMSATASDDDISCRNHPRYYILRTMLSWLLMLLDHSDRDAPSKHPCPGFPYNGSLLWCTSKPMWTCRLYRRRQRAILRRDCGNVRRSAGGREPEWADALVTR